jgi:hypothetical protein
LQFFEKGKASARFQQFVAEEIQRGGFARRKTPAKRWDRTPEEFRKTLPLAALDLPVIKELWAKEYGKRRERTGVSGSFPQAPWGCGEPAQAGARLNVLG